MTRMKLTMAASLFEFIVDRLHLVFGHVVEDVEVAFLVLV